MNMTKIVYWTIAYKSSHLRQQGYERNELYSKMKTNKVNDFLFFSSMFIQIINNLLCRFGAIQKRISLFYIILCVFGLRQKNCVRIISLELFRKLS